MPAVGRLVYESYPILILVKGTVDSSSTHTRHTTRLPVYRRIIQIKKAQDKIWQQLSSLH